ncbi:c-type cytochrome [Stieleria marina]|uniref:c-type cytochrome n=1 Tax=Stieleria marina TaxID=1930275 RepID=UPI003AF35F9C
MNSDSRRSEAGEWIWFEKKADNQTVYLRTTFDLIGKVQSASVSASADNQFTLFVNGERVMSGKAWEQLETADLTSHLKEGKNVFAVQAANQGGIAAFTLRADVTRRDGTETRVVTSGKWKASPAATKGWKTAGFDDSQWSQAVSLGTVGEKSLPWSGRINAQAFVNAADAGKGDFLPQPVAGAQTMDGFKLERLVYVPRQMGSWVSLTTADNGTLIASDQGKAGLYRITPSVDGGESKVQKLPVKLSSAQGLLWAFDSLYAVVNGGEQSGLHRITDTDGDGELDTAEHLKFIRGGGEHGPHAVILSPDKQSLFVCCGNHTELPDPISDSKIPRNWAEDHLLPRRWDANGHAAGKLAPGGWICQVDRDGKDWTVYSMGYRNEYDIAFNADGELFSYDADMEWDLGSPWYRPTRVVHATSGSEFGWRSGTGKWPTYYEDSLPPSVDIGPGSPVGIVFGYGAKFPAKYQRALFILDWTYSTIYAVHLSPEGSTYRGKKEDFVSAQPLQVTDATIGTDGALYFTAGGRGTQSSLYRVTYTGDEPSDAIDASDEAGKADRQLRRQLESWHGENQASNREPLDQIMAQLGNQDRFIRYAARVALETRPVDSWRNRLSELDSAWAIISGVIAISHQGSNSDRELALTMLASVGNKNLDPAEELGALRALQLIFTRLGEPTNAERRAVIAALSPLYPSDSDAINAELVQLLVYLDDPTVVDKTLSLMDNLGDEPAPDWGYLVERHKGYGGTVGKLLENMPPARGIHFAFMLRNQKSGWTLQSRRKYLQFFIDASDFPGGNSYGKFLSQFRDDALLLCSPTERVQLEDLASVSLMQAAPKVEPPKGPGRKWTRQEALPLVTNLRKRDLAKGRDLFHATSCAKCHRLGGEGGAIGPDLSTAGRKYPLPDLLDAVIEPSKAISDQYGSEKILTTDGDTLVGRVVRIDDKLHVYTIDADAEPKVIDEDDVEQIAPSKLSQMPTGLIDTLNEEELKDLIAYLLSGGNRKDKVYK